MPREGDEWHLRCPHSEHIYAVDGAVQRDKRSGTLGRGVSHGGDVRVAAEAPHAAVGSFHINTQCRVWSFPSFAMSVQTPLSTTRLLASSSFSLAVARNHYRDQAHSATRTTLDNPRRLRENLGLNWIDPMKQKC